MMFLSHISFALQLIALILGTLLFCWPQNNKGACQGFAKFIGSIVIVFAVLGMICNTYYTIKYWHAGYFNTPHPMMMKMLEQHQMMGNMNSSNMMEDHKGKE